MSRLKNSLFFIIFLLPILIFGFHPPNDLSIFIVHTNDIHGHIKPYQNCAGGMANLYSIINGFKKVDNCDLLIDSGDLIHKGDFIDRKTHGVATFKIFNKLHYDIFVPGNNELKVDYKYFKKFKRILKTPMLGLNIEKNNKLLCDYPYIIKDVKGIKMAFIGLSFDTTPNYVLKKYKGWEGIKFLNVKTELRKVINKVKNNVDLIVVISHNGLDYDENLMKDFPEVKLVISGHDHRETPDPIINKTGQMFVETGCYLHYVGLLELVFNMDNKKLAGYHYRLVNINEQPQNKISKLIKRYDKKYIGNGNDIVGYLNSPLNTFKRSAAFTGKAFTALTKADCAIMNDGTEREFLPIGLVTREWIYMKSPYHNTVVTVKMKKEDYDKLKTRLSKYSNIYFYEKGNLTKDNLLIAMDSYVVKQLNLPFTNTKVSVQDAQIKYLEKSSLQKQ